MIFIGTAGWNLPRKFAKQFPGDGSHLQRYARGLNCAEINSSFYRSHSRATYERWASAVPTKFKFSVKVPRAITHDARLRRARAPLRQFLHEIEGLGVHLGPLLIQLPPSFAFEARVAQRFLSLLRDLHRGSVVIEPRHISWATTSADRVLERNAVSRVAADPALNAQLARPGGALEKLRYYRLHGSPRIYWSNYSRARLVELASAIRESKAGVWIIFDNTAAGRAIANALQLQALVARDE
jgi:uncharacterized protein YecE (DUF72 family)